MDFYAIMENNTGVQEGMNDYGVSFFFYDFCVFYTACNTCSSNIYAKVINICKKDHKWLR